MPIFGGALRPYKSSPRMTPNPIGGQPMQQQPQQNGVGPSNPFMQNIMQRFAPQMQQQQKYNTGFSGGMQNRGRMQPQVQMGGNMNFWNPWSGGNQQGQGQDMYNPTNNPGGKNLPSGSSGMTNLDNITNPWLRSRIQTMR